MPTAFNQKLWLGYWRRAYWVSYLLSWLPYIRMIGLNGSMVTGTLRPESDIDFYIVATPGRIYTVRWLVTLLTHLLGVRRWGKRIAGRICLNRYAVTSHLEIGERNEYHARVFHNLIPLYATPQLYQQYLLANAWMADYGHPVRPHPIAWQDSFLQKGGRCILEKLLWWPSEKLEVWLRALQQKRMLQDERVQLPGSRVVLSDQELRFHLAKE